MLPGTNPLLSLAIVLVAAVAFGAIANRIRLPAMTGQILVGILMGPSILGIFKADTINGLQPITNFALGLIAVAVGSHLNIWRLRNAIKRLGILLFFEATLTPILVFTAVILLAPLSPSTANLEKPWILAALLAAMAVSTAPATIIAIVKETRSKGVFVKTLVAAVALNNIACIMLFEIAHTASRMSLEPGGGPSGISLLTAPLWHFAASTLLGVGSGIALIAATHKVMRTDRLATASIIAILLTAGLADYMGISSLLSCLVLGVTLANVTPEKEEIGHKVFDDFESAILAIFFTLAGLEMDLSYAIPGGLLALVVVVARIIGKTSAGNVSMRLAGATDRVRKYLGFALVPQAGLAVGLILLIQEDLVFEPIRDLFLAVGLTTVIFNEIIGPILTRFSLTRSGDFGQDRARLIDFIHEEHIIIDLKAQTKEEAIQQLTDLLVRTNNVNMARDELLESILQREKDMSTCFGEGLAIPHGELEGTEDIVGVMGISREGLKFQTPDGIPVHCMVLLATPKEQRDRHLEVLAAFAKTIGSDKHIQRQLFNAISPAHAYDILHAEELEDFNYFLED